MWYKKAFLNASDFRRFSCGKMLLGSILLTNQTPEEQKKPWTIEYPKVAMKNDVLLSRKVIFNKKISIFLSNNNFLNIKKNFLASFEISKNGVN